MLIKKIFLFFIILFAFAKEISAQNDELKNGSAYSIYGTGLPILQSSAQIKGMGILGVSFNDVQSPNLFNPAFWGNGSFSRASINLDYTNYSISDSAATGINSLFKIGNFHVVFPLSKNKLGLSVALYPETRSSYSISSTTQIALGNGTIQNYPYNNFGSGGITKFEIGLGYKINNNLSVGYAPSYSFLTEQNTEVLAITSNSNSINRIENRINGTAFSQRLGLLFSAKNSIRRNDIIQLGVSFTLPLQIDSEKTTEKKQIVDDEEQIVQIGATENGTITLPLKVAGGITYFPSPKFNASIEAQFENWKKSKYEFNIRDEQAFDNRFIVGAGIQYHPYRTRSKRFLSNFRYGAGVQYDQGHLNIEGSDISTLWFSTGIGLISPTFRSNSSFDLSLQYGIRGTKANNLIKENIWAINFSVNLTELMFFRRKLN